MTEARRASLLSVGLIPPGAPMDLQPWLPGRKSRKLMTRAVELGVAAIAMAVHRARAHVDAVPPERRAMFVGADPLSAASGELEPAIRAATDGEGRLCMARFARDGVPLIHPLWLLRGLSNNVLGLASAAHDFRGSNSNYCVGGHGGLMALAEAARAIEEGRADLAVAAASSGLPGAGLGGDPSPGGDAAASFLLGLTPTGARVTAAHPGEDALPVEGLGTGPAAPLVVLARACLEGLLPAGLCLGGVGVLVAHDAPGHTPSTPG